MQSAEEMLYRYENKLQGLHTPRSVNKVGISHATIPATYKRNWGVGLQGITLDELRVQVAVIADGHFQSKTNLCVLRLKRDRKVFRIRKILTAAGISYTEKECDNEFYKFTFLSPTRDKKFSSDYWECSQEQIDVIYDEVLHWDGSFSIGNRFARFTSVEKESIDFVQAVFNSKGHICSISEDYDDKYRNGRCYELIIRKPDSGLLHISGNNTDTRSINIEPSTDGFKYCFSVPSTFLLFRRNGCVFASGNTGKTCSILCLS